MKIPLRTAFFIGLALSIVSSGKEREMKNPSPFVSQEFSHFNAEGQSFQQGVGDEDFYITVPKSGKLEKLSLVDGDVSFVKNSLKTVELETSFILHPTENFNYLFYGTGVFLLKKNGDEVFEYEWNQSRNFIGYAHHQGDDLIFMMKRVMVESRGVNVELVKFTPNSRAPQTILSLPQRDASGELEMTPSAEGVVATRWRRSESVPAKFYDFEGKEAFNPLAAAMNAMHTHGVDLAAGDPMFPEFGGMFPSKNKDKWSIFSWAGIPGYMDSRLFVLSAIDSARVLPVKCEGHSLKPTQSLRFVVVHPRLNLFLVGARLDGDVTMYLGHVRREGSLYKPTMYRLRPFEQVWSPTFSRNGKVLLFATSEHGVEKVVFARLEDLLADINRRYPEAKLSLASLESEVK